MAMRISGEPAGQPAHPTIGMPRRLNSQSTEKEPGESSSKSKEPSYRLANREEASQGFPSLDRSNRFD
jgi:hypothetical protein